MIKIHLFIYKTLKLIYKILRFPFRIVRFFNAYVTGFFLGILKRDDLAKIDQFFYNNIDNNYFKDDYNKKPLADWEKGAIEQYFTHCKTILVIAAGGGREIYNLSQMGYQVDGSEYNTKLRDYAIQFLEREQINAEMMSVDRDKCPQTTKKYDGVVIGWGAYMHIKGRQNRLYFLKDVSSLLKEDGVILISFWSIKFSYLNLERVTRFGNFIAEVFKNEKIEKGDGLEPEFIHYFTEAEIEDEVKKVNFKVLKFDDESYGNIVGKKMSH